MSWWWRIDGAQRRPARPSRQLLRCVPTIGGRARRTRSLNEGRLGRAGNSLQDWSAVEAAAGRRTLNEGRLGRAGNSRNRCPLPRRPGDCARSTKAGSAEPATRPEHFVSRADVAASGALNEGRLGRAGNSAGIRDLRVGVSNAGQRSTKAGSAEPATLPVGLRPPTCMTHITLNEGRLGRAGNSSRVKAGQFCRLSLDARSTKAGSAEPATPFT